MKNQEFKVGDRVWSLLYGWGSVRAIKRNLYSVNVCFGSGGNIDFTKDGFCLSYHKNPSLFHANQGVVEFDTDEPVELEDGQPIWVRDYEDRSWAPKHFKRHDESGGVYCYESGLSKHTSSGNETHWKFFRTTDPALDEASQRE